MTVFNPYSLTTDKHEKDEKDERKHSTKTRMSLQIYAKFRWLCFM